MSLARAAVISAIVPVLLWVWLFHHLHFEWTINEQYNYGWAVPFLAAFLFYMRWQMRPRPAAPRRAGLLRISSWALLLALLPVRAIEEANPDWRLLSWTFALLVVAYSLLALLRFAGTGWLRHFAFPVCFPLVAVPWLAQFENAVVQGLTRAVAAAAVEIVGWSGVAAYQVGNVIELRNGFVGVDEACSGVKTLQAAIMVALFLGELLRLSTARRLVLVLLGCGWVFACNVGRATALVAVAATRGLDALKEWHDPIGTAVLVLGMLGLMAVAWLLSTSGDAGAARQPERATPLISKLLRPSEIAAAAAWLVAIFAATELWYRAHEQRLVERPAWQVRWPHEQTAVREMPIADETRAILRYNEASSAAWEHPPGVVWWTFFARWEPQQTALQLVRSHSPEICLPAVGRHFIRELEPVVVETGELPLRFRVYQFEQGGRPLFVYVCIQEDKVPPGMNARLAGEWNLAGRLRAVANGQRNLGQRLLELAVIGEPTAAHANEALARTVPQIVVASAITG